jgi:hypothetical protein
MWTSLILRTMIKILPENSEKGKVEQLKNQGTAGPVAPASSLQASGFV